VIEGDPLRNIEAEQALIGCLLANNAEFPKAAAIIGGPDFSEPLHRAVFETIATAIESGQVATVEGIAGALPRDLKVGNLSGAQYVARIADQAASSAFAERYARVIAEASARRGLISLSDRVRSTALGAEPGALPSAFRQTLAYLEQLSGSIDRKPVLRLRRMMFDEIDTAPVKAELVEGLFGIGDMIVPFGAPGSAKSTLIGDMGLHIAAGMPWFGRRVTQGGVIFVAAERRQLSERRTAAWRRYHGRERLPFAIVSGEIDLRSSSATADEIVLHAQDLQQSAGVPVRLVIIDTWSRALNGGDENGPKDTGAAVANVSRIQEALGVAVATVHHTPIEGGRLRGHSLVLGGADVTALIEKHADCRTMTIIKSNDGEEGVRIAFKLDSVHLATNSDTGRETTAPVVTPIDEADAPRQHEKKERPLGAKQKLAVEALVDSLLDRGQPLPPSWQMPSDLRAVSIEAWRDALLSRGVIDPDGSNPRTAFFSLKTSLLERRVIAEKDGLLWKISR
jgi:hypothetical protein